MIIKKEFYNKSAVEVAKNLLGQILVREIDGIKVRCKIVETEAYIGAIDKASHAYNGRRTKRTETLYEDCGVTYIYFIYGLYYCLNIITNSKDIAEGVLIRGIEPLDNFDYISNNRFKTNYESLTNAQKKNLTNGPSKLCMALDITKEDNCKKVYIENDIYIEDGYVGNFEIVETTRVGIEYAEEAVDFPWRFYIKGNKYVSVK
ncbi:DNA-3-methyladenine glycosylase [Clostridium carnis]